MPEELLKHLPQQWLGIVVLALFSLYALNKGIQESEALAHRFGRLGRKIQERHHKKHPPAIPSESLSEIIETAIKAARDDWDRKENEAIKALERRVSSIGTTSKAQADEIAELQKIALTFTAFARYDARWHNRVAVKHPALDLPEHHDFFEFEPLYRANPKGPWEASTNGSS